MDIKELLPKIHQHTQACWESVKQPALPAPSPAAAINPFVQIQKELKQKYPHLSDHELIVKSMDYLKDQFLQSVSQDDDASMRSSTSQTPSEQDSDPVEHVLAGESQLPEDAEPNLEIFGIRLQLSSQKKSPKTEAIKERDPSTRRR